MGWSAGKVDDVTACRIQDGGYVFLCSTSSTVQS